MPVHFISSRILVFGLCLAVFAQVSVQKAAERKDEKSSGPQRKVSCLGRLTPGDKVLAVSAPYAVQGPCLVKELFVHRGDRVTKGQVLARLHNFDSAEAQLRQTEADAQVAALVLEQVQAGEKTGTIAAQEALVFRLDAEEKNSASILRRNKDLLAHKLISEDDFEKFQLNWDVARENYNQATNQLVALKDVRSVDVRLADARLTSARVAVKHAQADLDLATIRAPIAGTVLDILTYPGEMLDKNPLLHLGDTDQMQVEAEVYVTDIRYVRLGANATIRGDGFEGEAAGIVFEIGNQVDRSSVFDPDPASFSDRRVVQVRIKVTDSKKLQALVNHQVNVVITP